MISFFVHLPECMLLENQNHVSYSVLNAAFFPLNIILDIHQAAISAKCSANCCHRSELGPEVDE